jgi:hypothetical protein
MYAVYVLASGSFTSFYSICTSVIQILPARKLSMEWTGRQHRVLACEAVATPTPLQFTDSELQQYLAPLNDRTQ